MYYFQDEQLPAKEQALSDCRDSVVPPLMGQP